MTREEKKIHAAATSYHHDQNEANLANLITAVMDLPLSQWPEGACQHKTATKDAMRRVDTGNQKPTASNLLTILAPLGVK